MEEYAFNRAVEDGTFPRTENKDSFFALAPSIRNIKARTVIVFAKDDPVLSNPFYWGNSALLGNQTWEGTREVPQEIKATLAEASKNPNILVFNPEMGGHMGYFLDSTWLSAIITLFF